MYSIYKFLAYWIVYSAVVPQQQIAILTQYNVGDTVNITCDGANFTDLKVASDKDFFNVYTVIRKTYMTNKSPVQIAVYAPFDDEKKLRITNKPPKHWQYQYSGGESRPNINSINLILIAPNIQCTDAGEYTCEGFLQSGPRFESPPLNVTVTAVVYGHIININLHQGDDYLSANYIGKNISLTCNATGPPGLFITWKQSVNNSAIENPVTGEISNNSVTPSIFATGCPLSNYTSKLEFELQETDEGNTYYCIVSNDTDEQSRKNFTLYINRILPEHRIVTETHYHFGDTFNITCDVKKFPGLKMLPYQDYLHSLALVRKTSIQPEDEEIVVFTPNSTNSTDVNYNTDDFNSSLPSQWLVQYSGGGNRRTIRVIVTAVNIQCSDAGEYKCRAELPTSERFFNRPIYLTVEAPISAHKIKINIHNANDDYLLTHLVGENIVLTCTVTGPPNLLIIWKQTTKDSTIENPATGEISSESTTPSNSSGCALSHYTSEIEFILQETDDGKTYHCIVSNDTGEQSRENFILRINSFVNSTSQPELQSEPQPELQSEPPPKPNEEPQPEPQPDPKPDSKPEPQPEPQPETKPEPQPESQPAGSDNIGWLVGGVVVSTSTAGVIYYFVIKMKNQDRNSQVSSKKGSVEPKNFEAINNDKLVSTFIDTSPKKITSKDTDLSTSI